MFTFTLDISLLVLLGNTAQVLTGESIIVSKTLQASGKYSSQSAPNLGHS